jgi:N-acetylglucosaminyldiphosphoundecaprenol N-acetyl-beta-D-mannosaminyltransferase
MGPAVVTDSVGHEAPVVERINLLGIQVSALDLPRAADAVAAAIRAGRREYVCIRDAHGVVRAQSDAALRAAHNEAFLVTPDGMPLVWALKRAGHRDAGRVYGPDLMLELFARSERSGWRHYLYGSTPAVLDRLEARLRERFPDARIVGRHAPPFRPATEAERAAEIAAIDASGADIVWVGLGTPKQELWMAATRPLLAAPMMIGVGAAFDFHAGLKPQAPARLQRAGLEWVFRLASEPRRLWRRYLTTVPTFAALYAAQSLGLKSFPMPQGTERGAATRPVARARPN